MKHGGPANKKRPDCAPRVVPSETNDVVEKGRRLHSSGSGRPKKANEPHRPHILYAEDDDLLRKMTTRLLTGAGYRVTAVKDGLAAWKALHTTDFDLLLTDNDMPLMSGLELAARVRGKHHDLKIIVTTATADLLRSRDYDWLRIATCLQKPVTRDELLTALKLVLHAGPSSGF